MVSWCVRRASRRLSAASRHKMSSPSLTSRDFAGKPCASSSYSARGKLFRGLWRYHNSCLLELPALVRRVIAGHLLAPLGRCGMPVVSGHALADVHAVLLALRGSGPRLLPTDVVFAVCVYHLAFRLSLVQALMGPCTLPRPDIDLLTTCCGIRIVRTVSL